MIKITKKLIFHFDHVFVKLPQTAATEYIEGDSFGHLCEYNGIRVWTRKRRHHLMLSGIFRKLGRKQGKKKLSIRNTLRAIFTGVFFVKSKSNPLFWFLFLKDYCLVNIVYIDKIDQKCIFLSILALELSSLCICNGTFLQWPCFRPRGN